MTIIFTILFLHLYFCFWSFGFAVVLTASTKLGKYAPAISALIWPTALIFFLSGAGHIRAISLFAEARFLIWLGPLFTLIAVVRFRNEIAKADWTTCILVHGLAILAGLLPLIPHIIHNDFGYFEFFNGEFLNYSQLAAHTLGVQHSAIPIPWEQSHAQIRDGIDFINATVALLTSHAPIHIVQLTSGLLRSSYCAGIFLLLFVALRDSYRGKLVTASIAVGFCFYNLDIFHFQISFMAANVAMSEAVILFSLLPTWRELPAVRVVAAYAICNTALLVTYPEATALFKLIEVAFVADRLFRLRDYSFTKWWIIANLIVVAVNPMMVITKIESVLSVSQSGAGWNFLGDPVNDLKTYLTRLVGLDFIYLPDSQVIPPRLAFPIVLIEIGGLAVAIFDLGRRLNTLAVAMIPIALLAFHIMGYSKTSPNFYGEMKIALWFTWIIPLAAASIWLNRNVLLRRTTLASIGVVACINIFVFGRGAAEQAALPTFYSEKEARAVIASMLPLRTNLQGVAIDIPDGIPLWYWAQIFDNESLPLIWFDKNQYTWFARGWPAAFLPQKEASSEAGVFISEVSELVVARPLLLETFGPALRLTIASRAETLKFEIPDEISINATTELYASPKISLYRVHLIHKSLPADSSH